MGVKPLTLYHLGLPNLIPKEVGSVRRVRKEGPHPKTTVGDGSRCIYGQVW